MSDSIKIMDLPENERPRERLIRYGAQSLSNSELIAVILRNGIKNENVLNLSSRLITICDGIDGIFNRTAEELMDISGIGISKASQIAAIGELFKRVRAFKSGNAYKISRPKDASDYVMEEMRHYNVEILKVIMLNVKNVVIASKNVSMGSLNSSIVHPREIFCEAIRRSCYSIIICHNHPSGDPTPSSEDINITHRIKECSKIIGIELLDHIIIGNGDYVSLKEKGIV
ncbi:DNA repair protein RadC [Clostridium sp. JN-9]|uniref:RadC family protein n=1 Tax=Clostridium sp. JN-9 TaxID=2507159 RepID=UPI000FFE1E7B|nr:DNA repair protein RadC [Clostridium sp. JN-9]QAT39581.1 JAB domain-containing protein [Clostridium sp. JN-9]